MLRFAVPELLASFLLSMAACAAEPAPSPSPLLGDANNDGLINVHDVQCSILVTNWQQAKSTGERAPSCVADMSATDVNCDGAINVLDTTLTIHLALGEPLGPTVDANANGVPDSCGDVEAQCSAYLSCMAAGEPELCISQCPGWLPDAQATNATEIVESPPQLGNHDVLVVFVDNSEGPPPCSMEQTQDFVYAVADWYDQTSLGLFTWTPSVHPTWIDIGPTESTKTVDWLLSHLASDGWDGPTLASFEHVLALYTGGNGFGESSTKTTSFSAGREEYTSTVEYARVTNFSCNSQSRIETAIHELGHNLGVGHASSTSSLSGEVIGYGDDTDIMGSGAAVFNGAYQEQLGWLDETQVTSVADPGVYGVRALENVDTAILRIPINEDLYYYVDLRSETETYATSEMIAYAGVSIRRVSWTSDGRFHTRTVDATPETPFAHSRDHVLLPGRTYSDLENGVHITTLSVSDGGALVYVHFGNDPSNTPPQVTSIAATRNGPDSAELTAEGVDPDNDPLFFFWSVLDGANEYTPLRFATGPSAIAEVTSSEAEVYLFLSDGRGGLTVEWFAGAGQPNPPPTVGGIQFKPSGAGTFYFAASVPGDDILSWMWDFGDGQSSTLPEPTHSYQEAGTYKVTLTVSNYVSEETAFIWLTIDSLDNQAPIANAGEDIAVSPGATGFLSGNGSYDPDGDTLHFTWTAPDDLEITSPGSKNTLFTAPLVPGVYEVELMVTDQTTSVTDTVVVTVADDSRTE